ncbi:MAG: BatA domain-containing protein [Kiritimatiellae bacterium]|nr:BatA domain-containing protein [Kiritimatiellia bacterium]
MLWGLAAALLPIVIHLLNRLRYRTVHWGAMMFLLRVARNSSRRSRLRHYLILACRALALAALALGMARPLAGGWLGSGWGRSPDAVIVLLDRSASMERAGSAPDRSRREQAVEVLAATPPERVSGSRIVLVDSAGGEPRELASLEALRGVPWTGPTDTAADWPVLFETAMDWIERHRPGRVEIWVASDGQWSNWRPDGRAWADLARRMAEVRPAVRVRSLRISGEEPSNHHTLSARGVRPIAGGGWHLDYTLVVPGGAEPELSAALIAPSGRMLRALPAPGPRVQDSVTVPPSDRVGWAGLELPADGYPGDNLAWFVFGPAPEGAVWASVEDAEVRARVENAFRPARASDAPFLRAWPAAGSPPDLNDTALIVWQGAPPRGAEAAALEAFVRDGGVVFALPPVEEPAVAPEEASNAPLWSWSAREEAAVGAEWRVARWESSEGPWARSVEGMDLPVGQGAIRIRSVWGAPPGADAMVFAHQGDGAPVMTRIAREMGRMYALATLPRPDWSDLGDGRVWVPMLWRMREEGARRLGDARMATCGEWRPADPSERWMPADSAEAGDAAEDAEVLAADPLLRAGVYRYGARWIALNRPPEEDDPDRIAPSALNEMLPGVRVDGTELSGREDASASEITWGLFLLAALFLLIEAALALGLHPRASSARGGRPGAPAYGREAAS